MGILIKPRRDEDFYVEWSTICDAPKWFGTREGLAAYLFRQVSSRDRRDAGGERHAREQIEDRLAHTDRHGTSSMIGEADWSDAEILLMEDGLGPCEGRPHLVRREDMRAFCTASDRERAHRLVCEKARQA